MRENRKPVVEHWKTLHLRGSGIAHFSRATANALYLDEFEAANKKSSHAIISTFLAEGLAMHVRHIVRQFAPMIGGLEDAVAQLAIHLERDQGINSSVVTLDRSFGDLRRPLPRLDEHLGIPIQRIPFRGSKRYPIALQVLDKLGDADLIHVHGIDFFFDYLALTRAFHRRPLVASTHGGFFHTEFASAAKRVWFTTVTRASASQYARIFGSSEHDAQMFRKIAPESTLRIENGVNIQKWHGASALHPQRTMIFIGRFSRNKNVPALVRLIKALGNPWRLIVAGQPSDLSAEELRAAARAHGVADRLEVHAGPSDQEMVALLSEATYICSASSYEGFGLSVVEGMSAGLTPLLTPIPPFERLIMRTGCGLLLDVANIDETARMIRAFHEHQNRSTRAANIAAASTFGWREAAARFGDAYRAVLDQDAMASVSASC